MEKIRNLSIRKTICLYMLINLLVSYFLSFWTISRAERIQEQIWLKYINEDSYYHTLNTPAADYDTIIPRIDNSVMSERDRCISEICDFLQTYSILLFSSMGTFIMVLLFYRNKLALPLAQLQEASNSIRKNNLNFSVTYSNRDELGALCAEFENMRRQLEINFYQLWNMTEQEKILRDAISHDIRSPLAIIKGYLEMLLEFIPQNTADQDQLLEMLMESMVQADRIDTFLTSMQKLSSVQQRMINPKETNVEELAAKYQDHGDILVKQHVQKKGPLTCEIQLQAETKTLWIDTEIVSEVFENLLTNAVRYAQKSIRIQITADNSSLGISIQDDGMGFPAPADKLTTARYHSNTQDDLVHFGLGLYLCQVYCKKHGGKLLLDKSPHGGARAAAVFTSYPPASDRVSHTPSG